MIITPLDELFGCLCVPYCGHRRTCVETAWVMPNDRSPEIAYFGGGYAKTVWELARDLTYQAST